MVLGLPKAYQRTRVFKPRIFYYVNYGYKNYEAIVNTPETSNRLHQSKKIVFSIENKRKKKALVLNQLIFIPHTKKKENFTIEIFKADFFRLNVELNTKTKKNDEIELFYYLPVCGAVYIYTEKTSRSSTYERPRC